MHFLTLARIALSNRIEEGGKRSYFSRIGVLALLNIWVLGMLLTTSQRGISIQEFSLNYVFFIPLVSLIAGLGAFESELLSGISEWCVLYSRPMILSRVMLVAAEVFAPSALFAGLLIASNHDPLHLFFLIGFVLVFSVLGLGLGIYLGFRHDKSVNNMVHLSTWVLGFGPGPFFGVKAAGYHRFFPGGCLLSGNYGLELFKLAAFLSIGFVLLKQGSRPRSRPLH